MGKFSLAQASVKWKFVIDVPDIFGLFLSPSWFGFMRADNNLFITQLIMREINLSRNHVFVLLCGNLTVISGR